MAHTWNTGDTITKELLNDLEARADRVGETGPQGPAGPAGPKGDTGLQGPAGPAGEGLTGIAVALSKISDPSSVDAQTIATKVNEMIDQGIARGLWTLGG